MAFRIILFSFAVVSAVQVKNTAQWGFMRNIINIDTFFKDPHKAALEL